MKFIFTLFFFCFYLTASAQFLEKENKIELPTSLSLLGHTNYIENPMFNVDLKTFSFSIDQLDKMRRGDFIITPKNINKNFTFLELPTINLNKELRKIMHQVPGVSVIAGPQGFTL